MSADGLRPDSASAPGSSGRAGDPSNATDVGASLISARLVITDAVILAAVLLGSQAFWLGIDTSKSGVYTHRWCDRGALLCSPAIVLFVLWMAFLKFSATRSPRVIGSGFVEYTRVANASFRLFGVVGHRGAAAAVPTRAGLHRHGLPDRCRPA